jgi:Icc protein
MLVEDVRLLQITDSHCYAKDETLLPWTDFPVYPNRSLQAVLAHLAILANQYKALIWTGDLVEEETPKTYQRLTEISAHFPLPIYAIPGNHDVPEVMTGNLGGQVQYLKCVELGNWRILLLDTHCPGHEHGSIDDAQFEKLSNFLAKIPAHQSVVIFMHHHPMDIDSEWLDKMGLERRERFWKLVESYPQVKAIFHGHIHQEFEGTHEYTNGRTVRVFGTPATCLQVKSRRKIFEFDHARPAWRDIVLRSDGAVETRVHYL